MGPFLQNVIDFLTVRVEDAAGTGLTGIAFGDASLSVRISKNGGGAVVKTLAAPDWVEQASGYYWLRLSATDTNTVGPADAIVVYNAIPFAHPFRVQASNVDAIKVDTAAIKAKTDNLPAAPSSQGSVDAVKTDTTAIKAKTDNLPVDPAKESTATAIKAKTDNLPANPASQTNLDVAVSTRLAASSYVAPDNAAIAAAVDAATHAMRAALGLFLVIRSPTYNPTTPDLATVVVRLYDDQASATLDDGATGLVVEFQRVVSYTGVELAGAAHQISKVVGT